MNSKANFEVLAQQLTDDIKANNASVDKKTQMKAKRLGDAAQAKGDKKVAETTKAEDENTLNDTNAECKATSKAVEILNSDAVAGGAEKHLPKLIQTGTSL